MATGEPQDQVDRAHAGADRRRMPRYPSALRRAWLGWRTGREFRASPAWLLDICMGGCLVAAGEEAPRDQVILVRLNGPLLPVWFESSLLRVHRDESGCFLNRLIFPDGCPYDLFMAAAYGHVSRDAARRQPPLPRFLESEARNGSDRPRPPFDPRPGDRRR